MGSLIPPALSLDCSFSTETWVPKIIGEFLAEVSSIRSVPEKILKLDDYVTRLQEEMKKIDAFKKELPLCMILLNDAITTMEEELGQCEKSIVEPKLEEFIPLKKIDTEVEKDEEIGDSKEKDLIKTKDKMNWMSSVQLWSSYNQNQQQHADYFSNRKPPTATLDTNKKRKGEVINRPMMTALFPRGKNRIAGKTIAPLKGFANLPAMMIGKEGVDEFTGVPTLSLRTPEIKHPKEKIYTRDFSSTSSSARLGYSSAAYDQSHLKSITMRKQRRSWSPELHRRFVNALQHLGGAQAATPKQIRELMRVDGLTNDEVKSHLQKYRLHSRRVPLTTNTSTTQLGGPWMSQEKCGESSKQSNSQSGSPQGPLHLAGSSRGTSMTGVDTVDEEDEEVDNKSESQSLESNLHLSGKDDA